ncbi:pentapeptide repeat-containing protein [Flavobacterium bizetiae]|uniref:pentapeptide repeat-containing protein n=1 Tax=Flavobacterium bizetiae TaxID=2704140 RepID=UPI003756C313
MKKNSFILLVLVLIVIYFYWDILLNSFETFACWLYPFDESRNAELLKIGLTVIGGLGILFGLYLNYKKTKATDKAIELQSLAISKQSDQLELSRKSQIDERFKNAVEHLGSDKEPIILGGVAVLHQIAIENPLDYSEVVFNILTSFIRSSTSIYTKKADDFSGTVIQTIINSLFKPKESIKNPYKDFKGNLSHCNLSSINIDNVDFDSFDLSFTLFNSRINNVNFSNANLSKSQFTLSRIKTCNFFHAELHQALFNMAEIKKCNFEQASVLATNFFTTRFFKVNFNNCNFSNSKFICCFFNETSHIGASVINNDFSFSNFKNVSFRETKYFSKVDLKGGLFYDVEINTTSSNLNFKSCNTLDVSFNFDFCRLLEKIEINANKKSNSTQIVNLKEALFYNEFNFDDLIEEDIIQTKKTYKNVLKEYEFGLRVKKKKRTEKTDKK